MNLSHNIHLGKFTKVTMQIKEDISSMPSFINLHETGLCQFKRLNKSKLINDNSDLV